jgi:hypothetical protein
MMHCTAVDFHHLFKQGSLLRFPGEDFKTRQGLGTVPLKHFFAHFPSIKDLQERSQNEESKY